MRAVFLSLVSVVVFGTGCASTGGGVLGGHTEAKMETVSLDESDTETRVRRTTEVVCKKPVTNPDIHGFDRMLKRYAAQITDTPSAHRLQSQYGLTYRQEVMSYRLCMDYANGILSSEQFLQQNKKLLNSVE
jgi:hypothetical protein